MAREDLVMFVNACFACTGQREFHGDARGQQVSIEFLHQYILGNYRRLYARTLAAGVNHFNQAQIILNLLASGQSGPAAGSPEHREEGALIAAAMAGLPPQRAYGLLAALRDRGVNNRRARAVARRYLAARPDPAFDAVKYRAKLRGAARHAHLELPGELGQFLLRGWKQRVYQTPLLERFRQAHYAEKAVFGLPFTVAEGLAEKHGVSREELLEQGQAQMTVGEKLRLQESARAAGVAIPLDLGRVPLTRLALYVLSLDLEARRSRLAELEAAMARAAARTRTRTGLQLGKVAAVLDRSYSSSGSSEKRRRPLGVALAAGALLRAACREYRTIWSTPLEGSGETEAGAVAGASDLLVTPRGQTRLARPLLEALRWGAELVIIISDGFENDPPGMVSQLCEVHRVRVVGTGAAPSVVHLNPVFDAQHFQPRTLGPAIPTAGLRDAEDLPTMLGFVRFADGSAPLAELEAYLAGRMAELLGTAEPDAEEGV